MKAVILCLLFVSFALATQETEQKSISSANGGLTLAELQKIQELKDTKWGDIFFSMAEMQLGPIQRLVQTLDDLTKELEKTKNDENTRFGQKKATHEANVQTLNTQINEAKSEINANKLKISTQLEPRKKQAEADITRDNGVISDKRVQIQKAKDARKAEHEAFEARVNEHNAAIEAADQCLNLVSSLLHGSGAESFVEIKKATLSIRRLEMKLRHTHFTETPLIEALIGLVSSQNFSNQDSVNKVLTLLSEFRAKLAASLSMEKNNEAKAQKDFEDLLAQLDREITELTNQIKKNTNLIAETTKAIDDAKNIINVKSMEQIELQTKLEGENEAFRKETVTHQEVITEVDKELDVIKQCRTIFANAQFGSYVTGKMH